MLVRVILHVSALFNFSFNPLFMPNVGHCFIYDLALAFCFVSCFIVLCALLYIRCALWRLLSCCFCLSFEGADELGWGIIANLCASFVLLFKNVYALYSSVLRFYIGGLKVHYSIFFSTNLAADLEFASCLTTHDVHPKKCFICSSARAIH